MGNRPSRDESRVQEELQEEELYVEELPPWENLWDWCLQKHYERNRHHPEHFENGWNEMTRDDRLELTCDLLGSVMGHALKNDLFHLGLEDCRALIENQRWRHWRLDETVVSLPPASKRVPILPPRWKVFPEEERMFLKECYERLRSGDNNVRKEIERELMGEDGQTPQLPCVAYYMRDLYFHRLGVERVWRMLFPGGDERMESRIRSHDGDKYRIEMVIGYTQKWCF